VDVIADFMGSINTFDLLVFVGLFGAFVLGYIQGTIRRLMGIASMLFSFLVAAHLSDWAGGFLAANWTQWPPEYAKMVGFLVFFGAAVVAFTLVIQGTYQRAPLFATHHWVDEVLGGLLGVLQAVMLLVFVTIILDTFFLFRGIPPQDDELPFLRTFWTALDTSATGVFLHETLLPALVGTVGFLLPESIRVIYSES